MPTPDIAPVDYSTPVGIVRNLIQDIIQRLDPANPTNPPEYLFSDARLQAFIDNSMGTGSTPRLRFAAADAIDVLADNEILIAKKIRTEDLQTDGPAVGNALRLRSTQLRAQQKLELDEQWELDYGAEIVEYTGRITGPPTLRHNYIYGELPWL